MEKFKVNGQSVAKIEWKQTDGQTDGGDRITSHANAVGNKQTDRHYNAIKYCTPLPGCSNHRDI